MNAASFFWVMYWLAVMLVLACSTWGGVIASTAMMLLCLYGFATSREDS
jgi:hypothetical protein